MVGIDAYKIIFFFFVLFITSSVTMATEPLSGLNLKDFNTQTNEQVTWQNNPFVRPANEVSVGELALTGIVSSKDRAAAIINGQIVEKGDKIGSHVVVSIEEPSLVILRTENGLFRLKMKGYQ
ncbi:hypothetical protein KJ708_04695 [bacterium]|nr:hypothetical protein [bacterium]MBU1916828.1 hypothetical protein [bacterium]